MVASGSGFGDAGPGDFFAPDLGRVVVWKNGESGLKFLGETLVEGLEAEDARVGLSEIDGVESGRDQDGQAPGTGEGGGTRGENFAIVEQGAIGGAKEKSEFRVGEPLEMESDVGNVLGKLLDGSAVGS